jgi:hypothetical protein
LPARLPSWLATTIPNRMIAANAVSTTLITATARGTRSLRRPETAGASANVRSTAVASGMKMSRPKYSAAIVATKPIIGG